MEYIAQTRGFRLPDLPPFSCLIARPDARMSPDAFMTPARNQLAPAADYTHVAPVHLSHSPCKDLYETTITTPGTARGQSVARRLQPGDITEIPRHRRHRKSPSSRSIPGPCPSPASWSAAWRRRGLRRCARGWPASFSKRVYKEGTDVEQGQVLYLIDPAPLEAALHAQEAALARARGRCRQCRGDRQALPRDSRQKQLISTQDLDNALANERSTAAAVKQAQADVESARLDLGYATVTAPIAGRAGRALVTEGALVGQGEATATDHHRADRSHLRELQPVGDRAAGTAGQRERRSDPAQVDVLLQDGTPYPHPGTLDFSDLAVDPAHRRRVAARRAAQPGPFAAAGHVRQPAADRAAQSTTPSCCPRPRVSRDDQGAYVLVVDADGKVAQRRAADPRHDAHRTGSSPAIWPTATG